MIEVHALAPPSRSRSREAPFTAEVARSAAATG